MKRQATALLLACLLTAGTSVLLGWGQQPAPAPAVDTTVPEDLRPLLQPRQSEMRLVVTRYTLDRATLSGNYQGGMQQRGAGRGSADTAAPSLSLNRIARLKRFDLDWQAALERVDAARLSPAGRKDLDSLRGTLAASLARLDAEAANIAALAPLVPFAPAIVRLVESRIRMEDADGQKIAGELNEIGKQVAAVQRRVEAGLAGGSGADALRVGKDLATRAAAAIGGSLLPSLAETIGFYNGYDPLVTWWTELPFKKVNAALQAYATLLRDKVAAADDGRLGETPLPGAAPPPGEGPLPGEVGPALRAGRVDPAPPPEYPSVPDLEQLIALPQDEMTAVVQRFRGVGASGDRGAAPGQNVPPPARDRAYYQGWLKALRTLDFAKLSRNAQIDYLYIRKMAEQHVARDGAALPPNPPRKTDSTGIPGAARGRQGLIADLQDQLIPYAPEELIAIGEKELAWCEAEMKRAAAALGFGDWKQALEKVKTMHPPPGGQAGVVRDLVFEAVDFLRARDLLTVPAVGAESLRMIMMTPERQLVNPFFTGGNLISVSYPTNTMEYEARLQSMRGNNTPFSHATAFHEMIPGHNLVYYTSARFAGYRPSLATNSPFYSEGWPLYWELLMYDVGFHDTPEKRIGALFWRMHRGARIIFSMKFHLGEWSPQECIDFLVDRVGFERDNATGEVRRSFQGGYGPLYQAAYLLGGLQLRAVRRELVDSGQMGEKAFHDEVLRQGAMPIALLRLALGRQKLTPNTPLDWRFYALD